MKPNKNKSVLTPEPKRPTIFCEVSISGMIGSGRTLVLNTIKQSLRKQAYECHHIAEHKIIVAKCL